MEKKKTKFVLKKDNTGIEKKEVQMSSRKHPLINVREKSLQKHANLIRTRTDEEYSTMSRESVESRLRELHENLAEGATDEQLRDQLSKIERKRHWLLWHDHSGIGNQGIIKNYSYPNSNCCTIMYVYEGKCDKEAILWAHKRCCH